MSHNIHDPTNRRILLIAEDRLNGFQCDPFQAIARRARLPAAVVLERIHAMMRKKIIRRVRQTLNTAALAHGALVAWKIPPKKLHSAFDWIFQNDPFTGHVAIRASDDPAYHLWTTLKVPLGVSLKKHCQILQKKIGAENFCLMPTRGAFLLSVGHIRRQNIPIGARAPRPVPMQIISPIKLTALEWNILNILKPEFSLCEIQSNPWRARAQQAGIDFKIFCHVARQLAKKNVLGRFSVFLEHAKPVNDAEPLSRFNALFHWAVPRGLEKKAGTEIARHRILTHCYWRQTSKKFHNVNLMAVAHGSKKEILLQHKENIDAWLARKRIPIHYTATLWSHRIEIKPSEISPDHHTAWLAQHQTP